MADPPTDYNVSKSLTGNLSKLTRFSARSAWASRQRREYSMFAYRLDGFQQVTSCIGLHYITSGTRVKSLAHHLRRVVLGDEQNLKAGLWFSLNQPASLKPIHSRHSYVEHYDIGLQTVNFFERFKPVGSFANDLPPGPPFQKGSKALANDRVIIDEQDPNWHHSLAPLGHFLTRCVLSSKSFYLQFADSCRRIPSQTEGYF
jgi:hypothetical protein